MDRRVLLLVLLLEGDERLAGASVIDRLSRVSPGRRVAVVDGQAQLRTLTPLTEAKHLAGIPHLPIRSPRMVYIAGSVISYRGSRFSWNWMTVLPRGTWWPASGARLLPARRRI